MLSLLDLVHFKLFLLFFFQDVPTMEACRDLCLTAPYRCHSFDYGDTGQRVCRLSHHTSVTLTQIQVIERPILIKLKSEKYKNNMAL